jgi:hypothetical protein
VLTSLLTSLLPRLLREEKDHLFPNSPIEVRVEMGKFAIYCEGEWIEDWETLEDARWQIDYTLHQNAEYWCCPACRICPDWVGWLKISPYCLVALENKVLDDGEEA